ncbi:MAG: hypothetical protein KTR31_14930 [Myxococcales bacterium]|nr:hypothetical protein [Myxococcales bacterium]
MSRATLCLLAAGLAACASAPEHQVMRVSVQSPHDLQLVNASALDVFNDTPRQFVDALLDRTGRGHLRRAGLDAELLVADVDAAVAASLPRFPPTPGDVFEDWRDLETFDAHLDLLAAEHAHATVIELGTSVENRPIRGLRLADPALTDPPGILVTGVQHAREWVAGSSALFIADRLAEEWGQGGEADAVLDEWQVIVVPIVNPDGYRFSWTTDRLWRKNRRDNADGTFGVDLNRNWGEAWGGAGGSSAQTANNNYRGASAFSEPEAASLRDLVLDRPELVRHLDLHCTGQLVLYPWGYTAQPSPDEDWLSQTGTAMQLAMEGVEGTPYAIGQMNPRLYQANGLGIDWTHEQGLRSTLVELRDRGQYGFLLPADQLRPTAEEAWAGFVALAAMGETVR